MSEKVPQKKDEKEEKRRFGRDFWISTAISFAVGTLFSGFVLAAEIPNPANVSALGIATDALGIPGLLLLFVFVLQWVASYGLFDILSYGVQVLFLTVFRPNYRKTGFPATFLEYKEAKNRKERKPMLAICLVAGIFILAAIVVYACYLALG